MYVLLKPFWQFWNQASVWIKGICSSYFDSRVTRSKLTRPTFVCMHTKQPRALLGISSPPSGLSMFFRDVGLANFALNVADDDSFYSTVVLVRFRVGAVGLATPST